MYSIEFSNMAEKQFAQLPHALKQRVVTSLERIRFRPYAHIKRLVGSPHFSFRVGHYRLILNIVEEKLIIFVVEVGHRRNVYKK